MSFALLFTIVLAVILILGAIVIWKSDLPANDKLISLVVIMALFAAVSIVNEAKRSAMPKVKAPLLIGDFEKTFYVSPFSTRDLEAQDQNLPQLEDNKKNIKDSLNWWNPVNSSSYSLTYLYADESCGVSTALKDHVRHLQSEKQPVLYLQLKHPEFTMLDFITTLKVADIEVINKAVAKINEEGYVPTIIIDNIHNALVYDETPSNRLVCPLCKYLVSLYDTQKVNIIMLSNDPHARDYLQADYTLRSKISFQDLKEKDINQLKNYLVEEINKEIEDEAKKFTDENVRHLYKRLGWNYGLLHEYRQNLLHYSNVKDFVHHKLHNEAKRVASYRELWDFLSTLISLTEEKQDNSWIPYSVIRKVYPGNPTKKIDDALNARLIVKENNSYRFANSTIYNAVLIAKGIEK